jgi:hypothetical protein
MSPTKVTVSLATTAAAMIAASVAFVPPAVSSPEKSAPPVDRAVEAFEPRTSAKLVVAASDTGCPRIRRRLWVEGEGWIVRRVALCQ